MTKTYYSSIAKAVIALSQKRSKKAFRIEQTPNGYFYFVKA